MILCQSIGKKQEKWVIRLSSITKRCHTNKTQSFSSALLILNRLAAASWKM
jgi:hypothetical protein